MLTDSSTLEFHYYVRPDNPCISECNSPPAKHGVYFQFFEFFHSDFCKSLTKDGRIKFRCERLDPWHRHLFHCVSPTTLLLILHWPADSMPPIWSYTPWLFIFIPTDTDIRIYVIRCDIYNHWIRDVWYDYRSLISVWGHYRGYLPPWHNYNSTSMLKCMFRKNTTVSTDFSEMI